MSASDAGSVSSKTRDGPPTWNGAAETFQAYEEAARLFEQTTAYEKRYLCGPKLQNALEGAAQRLVVGKRPDWLSDRGGVDRLLNHLRQCLGKPQMPELTDLLNRYFRASKRKAGETMNGYITRKCEIYVRCQQALNRVRPHHSRDDTWKDQRKVAAPESGASRDRRPSGDSWSSYRSSGQRATGEPTAEVNQESGTPATTPAATETASEASEQSQGYGDWNYGWRNQGWYQDYWSWGYNNWQWGSWTPQGGRASSQTEEEAYPEVVPEFIQAWLLLSDANLEIQERNLILTAIQGELNLQRVAQELRTHFPDTEVQRRDGQRRHQGYLGSIEEETSDVDQEAAESHFPAEQELNEEGYAAWTEAEAECQQALAAMQHARRTLKGARERQKMVKLNRQYFRSSSSGQASESRRDEKITCLRCGQAGHRAANCPAPHPKEGNRGSEIAPFVCYADTPEGIPTLWQDPAGTPCICFTTSNHEQALQLNNPGSPQLTTPEAVDCGKAIIDCGATKSLGSVYALEKVMQLSSNGIDRVDTQDRPVFGFGNSSEDRCVSTLHLNLLAGGRQGQLKVHALDKGTAPILFSVSSLKALGAVVDFGESTMVLRNVDPNRLMYLEQSRTGHLLLPLTGDLLEQAVATHAPVPNLSDFVQSPQGKSSEDLQEAE